MIDWHKALRLYFVAGTQDIQEEETLCSVLEEAMLSGITCYQFREKGEGSLHDYIEQLGLCMALKQMCRAGRIPLVINDNVKLAIDVGADAVHVGQSDQNILEVIELVKPHGIDVGLSVNTLKELTDANDIKDLAYVGIGPVFLTQSKEDAKNILGLEELNNRADLYPSIPKVAIGGISITNARDVLNTGVDGIAVISAITKAEDRENDILQLLKA